MAQALADAGVIAAEDVKSHRQRHILTGALGAKSGAPRVELGRHDLRDGDRVLVASDGLTEMVSGRGDRGDSPPGVRPVRGLRGAGRRRARRGRRRTTSPCWSPIAGCEPKPEPFRSAGSQRFGSRSAGTGRATNEDE